MKKIMVRASYVDKDIDPEQFDIDLIPIMSFQDFKEEHSGIYEAAKECFEEKANEGHEEYEDDYEYKYFENLSEKEQAEYIEKYERDDEIFCFSSIDEQEIDDKMEL